MDQIFNILQILTFVFTIISIYGIVLLTLLSVMPQKSCAKTNLAKFQRRFTHMKQFSKHPNDLPAANPLLLAKYFPKIRSRQEILQDISSQPILNEIFSAWEPFYQEDFLDSCSGNKGMTVLYDGIFKEIFNPEHSPQRLSQLLSLILDRKAAVKAVLPNDSVRLGAESSLLYTDIIVELEDGSLANIEIQKIGYAFPGERCACYSADHLLRQYKRVRGSSGKNFNYRDIKRVYTLVFFEKSPAPFHQFPNNWIHKFSQASDTGLMMELLQEYFFIPLDIFRKTMENKTIDTVLEAWLAFLSFTSPSRIEELITRYPQFIAMYQDIYELCLNTEKVMTMYSKELEQLDRNTVLYMIDELQEQIDSKKQELNDMRQELSQTNDELFHVNQELSHVNQELSQTSDELSHANAKLSQTSDELSHANAKLSQKDQEIAALKAQLAAYRN